MKVEEFVKEYCNVVDNMQDKYIGNNVEIIDYVSVVDKINDAKRIISATSYSMDNNGVRTGEIEIDTVNANVLSKLQMIDRYTNIDIDFGNVISEYDLLSRYNLVNQLLSLIPEHEFYEYTNIFDATLSDFMKNKCSGSLWVKNNLSSFMSIVSLIAPIVENMDMDGVKESVN